MASARIGIRHIKALAEGETLWDEAVVGFGIRRQKGPSVAYILKFRTLDGRQRWMTIGRHGAPWTPDSARLEARRLLGLVVRGEDPASTKLSIRHAVKVSEFCDSYMDAVESGRILTRRGMPKSASTIATDKGRIERHIKPLLGHLAVTAVSVRDIKAFLHDVAAGRTATRVKSKKKRGLAVVRGGKGAASRTVGLVGGIFTYAVSEGLRTDNPVHGVVRFADNRRERRLFAGEYALANNAIDNAKAENFWPPAVAAARFLLVTGWRSGEVCKLRWSELDLSRRYADLKNTKTGRSIRPLSEIAVAILREQPRVGTYVFPAMGGDIPMTFFYKTWAKIAALCDARDDEGAALSLPSDITPQVLRHSFASEGNDLQYSELTIGAIIGHRGGSTITADYIHTIDSVLLKATDRIAMHIVSLMEGEWCSVNAA